MSRPLDDGLEMLVYKKLSKVDKNTKYVIGSGSIQRNEDIVCSKYLIQCKHSLKKYRINVRDVHRLYVNSIQVGKIPIFIVRIKNKTYVYQVTNQSTKTMTAEEKDNTVMISYNLSYIGTIDEFVKRVSNENTK